jgi:hypothetical protein
MKVHVYGFDKLPLVWDVDEYNEDGRLIDFETVEEAEIFLETAASYWPNVIEEVEEIVEDIMYYDGGYIPGVLAMELMKKEIEQMEKDEYWRD